ncbi:MAG: bifunctional UDP-N-acetylglucosamine diphosphorylase/glucosamine-1-phosphate N-acetyltransferase GlmU [Alphaproteobacteria bacterium]|nr:bifunctional UDP-N-acetylglucosamine diphosphorylase/glucosamine-1-phosphate N-acetyltransferase GlmU [Alphaproteobacteria bacterium]
MPSPRAAIILAAGQGTRMQSRLPKVLHKVGGRALLDWAIAAAAALDCARTIVVSSPAAPEVGAHGEQRLGAGAVALQHEAKGTGHAVLAAKAALDGFDGDVVILYGDTPLIRPQTVEAMFAMRAAQGGLVVLGFEAADPTGYGRLVMGDDDSLLRIVEHRDADAAERAIGLCNSGVFVAERATLFNLLSMVRNDNAKGEYYLTDIVALGRSAGIKTHVVVGAESEMLGVNARSELAEAEAAFQARARAAALDAGVTMLAPETVYFSFDTNIGADAVIEPNVFFGPGVSIGSGAHIKAFSHLEGCAIGEACAIGPFARLRPGAKLERKVKIGNFVEIKNATFGEGAQASHLTYVGDADIGARANLGAGTITCNYDGFDKHRTVIGEGAFIGSDTALVAPVRVGAGAYTGSGSVITKDVAPDALSVARGRQRDIDGWAKAFRARKLAEREKKS